MTKGWWIGFGLGLVVAVAIAAPLHFGFLASMTAGFVCSQAGGMLGVKLAERNEA